MFFILLKKIIILLRELYSYVFYSLRGSKISFGVKIYKPWRFTPKYVTMRKKVTIRNFARIEGISSYAGEEFFPEIIFDDYSSVQQNLHLTCAQRVYIGRNTAIAANVTITDINHCYVDITVPPERQPLEVDPVHIGENCKIYNNAVILPGTTLGKHNIVGANSVVSGTYPDYCVIAGVPAKMVRKYNKKNGTWEKV